jgi:hypothetical protein
MSKLVFLERSGPPELPPDDFAAPSGLIEPVALPPTWLDGVHIEHDGYSGDVLHFLGYCEGRIRDDLDGRIERAVWARFVMSLPKALAFYRRLGRQVLDGMQSYPLLALPRPVAERGGVYSEAVRAS